jgi:succinyl-CoA synthetase alpha subunit
MFQADPDTHYIIIIGKSAAQPKRSSEWGRPIAQSQGGIAGRCPPGRRMGHAGDCQRQGMPRPKSK